ncbi:uncharacterized protein IL334_007910 [Kwoniella shivajii]|uniref:Cytoplasmic protein n=1 Tax=Kwoniella shivajii TaxID=564305 RepID=A0ABZ1DD34_9TREE|nr:hypothetical protein IL334_007910 [Kwoniella shivajii]
MSSATSITWPSKYLPGLTDNFVSNEMIVKGITARQIWTLLADITKWESYYDNCSEIKAPPSGPILAKGDEFSFSTFGFPPLPSTVAESIEPTSTRPGRLAWMAQSAKGTKEQEKIDVYHAWIIEDLDQDRVRILTQESQIGQPAKQLSIEKPNKMLNGHQDWLDGLIKSARELQKQG